MKVTNSQEYSNTILNMLNINQKSDILEISKLSKQSSIGNSSIINTSIDNTSNTLVYLNEKNHKEYGNLVDYRYICIKKEHFDPSMIYLNYINLKKRNNIEIIYRSPSIFLEGLFFKTPIVSAKQLLIFTKDKSPYTTIINLCLNSKDNRSFINMLKSIDVFISNYIARHSKQINKELHDSENADLYLKYETILKPRNNSRQEYQQETKLNTNSSISSISTGQRGHNILNKNMTQKRKQEYEYEITFKSYLDKKTIDQIANYSNNKKFIITFNITNIFINKNILIPLIKCNKCEEVFE
jgi:hypothetical protein